MRNLLAALIAGTFVMGAAVGFAGCCSVKENAAATAKCSKKASNEDCSKCCKDEGVSGHAYSSGDCKCMDIK